MARGLDGTFFEIHHHNTAEGKYWNPALDSFTAENWREKVREIAALKMEYIVVMATALYDRCYFESSVFLWRISPAPILSKRCSTRRTNAA